MRQPLRQLGLVGDPIHAPLAARIDRLQHRRNPDRLQLPPRLDRAAQLGESRLGDPVLVQACTHRRLIGHHPGRRRPDPGQAEPLRDRRRDRNRPIGRDRDDRIDPIATGDIDNASEVGEIDRFSNISRSQAHRLRISIDGNHRVAGRARLPNRGELRNACPQKEDRRHQNRSYDRPKRALGTFIDA